MKVSIITVCYNAEKTIQETIESVLNQTYKDFEYIIQDGSSSDNTMKIVEEYAERFRNARIKYRYESEPDTGIYNAMNKATSKANGEWCIYMNADDSFYSNRVLQEVFEDNDYEGYDAVFGAYCRHDEKNKYVFQSEAIDIIPRKMPFVHQTIFVRTNVFRNYGYDEQYRLCADYDAFFKMYADGRRFRQIPNVVSNYSVSGASGESNIDALEETIQIQKKHSDQYPISFERRIRWKMKKLYLMAKNQIPESTMIILRKAKAVFITRILKKDTMQCKTDITSIY